MAPTTTDLITVSPPNVDRTGFDEVDRALAFPGGPVRRQWLVDRFRDGLQMRMLRLPETGLVAFAPARAAWRPIAGADRAVIVEDLRIDPARAAPDAARRLWREVERWARYYGFASVVALCGRGTGLIDPELLRGTGPQLLDGTGTGLCLMGRILSGPVSVPRLVCDGTARRRALGPGLVIQSAGACEALEGRGDALMERAAAIGLPARRDRLTDARDAQARAVLPSALFAAILDGELIGGPDTALPAIWRQIARRKLLPDLEFA